MDNELKVWIHKRATIKTKLTNFKKYLNNNKNAINIPQLKLRTAVIENILQEFEELQTEIELKDNDGNQVMERTSFEDSYFEVVSEAKEIIRAHDSEQVHIRSGIAETSSSHGNNQPLQLQVRLPTINLPTFSGSFDEWKSFKESFQALVDSNQELPSIQKFYYLKSCLKGEAVNVIHSLEASSANYKVAWDLLKDRFENTRLIVNKYVSSLFNLPNLNTEGSHSIRVLLDDINKNVRALEALGQPTEHWGTLLVHMISSKLPIVTLQDWEKSCDPKTLPKLTDILTFLGNRSQILETIENQTKMNLSLNNPKVERFDFKSNNQLKTRNYKTDSLKSSCLTTEPSFDMCRVCNKAHKIFQCEIFLSLKVSDRISKVKSLGLCFNCLKGGGHHAHECKSRGCKLCTSKHNTLLHISSSSNNKSIDSSNCSSSHDKPQDRDFHTIDSGKHTNSNKIETNRSEEKKPIVSSVGVSSSHSIASLNHVLLPTAVVNVEDVQGNLYPCRVLLDSASQCNFISEHMAQVLRLKKERVLSSVVGVSQTTTNSSKLVHATLRSRFTSYCTSLDFIVLSRITVDLPSVSLDISSLNLPFDLELADPNWHTPSRIDMLIGAEVFMDLLNADQSSVENIHPNLKNTRLGVVVSGKSQVLGSAKSNHMYASNFVSTKTIESQLQRFWAIDEISSQLSAEDSASEKYFNDTTKRDSTGRYIVSMPLNTSVDKLGDSFKLAKTRLEQMERRFANNPKLHTDYTAFIKEYQDLGHMEPASDTDSSGLTTYYLPHHAVLKETSSTTKLRVVFDGSAKPSDGLALNEALLVGPCIQQDLFSIVSRFRTYNYAINSDIEKMYRQINIEEKQQDILRILWREDPLKPIQIFKLTTVTYGTSCAPYLSTRTLLQLAKDEGNLFPQAAEVLKRDFYMDDLLTGSNTIEGAKKLQSELSSLLSIGGFHLRKWTSNCDELLLQIPEEDREFKNDFSADHSTKTLGLLWNASADYFHYSVNNTNQPSYATKRTVLSELSQIFDPLGLIEPVIIQAKMFVQHLWKLEIGWDEKLPDSLQELWIEYKSNLVQLDSIQIPRRVLPADNSHEVEIHAFCDASQTAYGACIYVRQTDVDGKIQSRLLCSKSRVAPINKITLPRLELCAALLLSRLIRKVLNVINLTYKSCTLWSDSTIVLAWLNSSSSRWKTFVANRVSEIQNLTKNLTWKHVRTYDNPADIVSRGATPVMLKNSSLWWYGPPWLSQSNSTWPHVQEEQEKDYDMEECKVSATVTIDENITDTLINKHSSFLKLQRVLAYCLRFVHNTRSRSNEERFTGTLSPQELQSAQMVLIKTVQKQAFSDDFNKLKSMKSVNKKSKLKTLSPFLDDNEIIRVGGRLQQSSMDYDHKHAILLPKCKFTKLLVTHFHKTHLHAGPQQLLAVIRQRYWPVNGRSLVKKVCKECITCFRVNPKLSQQLMGSLPKERVEPNRPFINTGVDFCGPVFIKSKYGRGNTTIKTYIAIFICLSVKAVHIELVHDLTSEAFIAALKRFMARRGRVSKIFSDNGSNFVGANNELRELKELFEKENHTRMVTDELANQNIEWKFIPPGAPHFGGLWEAAVKSTKFHLKRVTHNNVLTYDEMNTLLTQIEACLNSRPLSPISDDPADLTYLTPGHFLIGEALTTILEPDLKHIQMNRLSRWQKIQQMFQHFWERWSTEYLHHLQSRGKWLKDTDNLMPNDMVLVQDSKLPPMKWKTGRVIDVHPGKDHKVRVVTVKTTDSTMKRAITSLCPFPKIEDL